MDKSQKPPLGITPKIILEEKRLVEIINAINRYLIAECVIPEGWIEEYNDLILKTKNFRKARKQ